MKLQRRTTIIESQEDGTIKDKPEIKAEPVMQQDFAGALEGKEANEEAAKKAVEDSENKKNAEELAKELGSHKTPAPKTPSLKPFTEAIDVKDREELSKLITECKAAGRVFKIKRSVKEGFRYVYEDFVKEYPKSYFITLSEDLTGRENGYFDVLEEAVEFAQANPDTISCVFKVAGDVEEKVWEKPTITEACNTNTTNEGCESGECCPKCGKHPCECKPGEEELHEGELTEAELNEADEKLNLKKHGFVRAPEEDFSDDGARFTCYYYDPEGTGDTRFRLSKHIGNYGGSKEVFIDVVYHAPETGRSKYFSDLNGVSLETAIEGLPKLVSDIEEFKKGIEDFNKVTRLTDEQVKEVAEEVKFLMDRAGLGEYQAIQKAYKNKGIEFETLPYDEKRKLYDFLRNTKPYDKEALAKDIQAMIKGVIHDLSDHSSYLGRKWNSRPAKSITDAILSNKYHISQYPDEIQKKIINHISKKLAELKDFKIEALEEDISGKIIDRITNEIISDLEKDGLVESLISKLNESQEQTNTTTTEDDNKPLTEDIVPAGEDVNTPTTVDTTVAPEVIPEDEIEIDKIETFVPVGEPATNTFMSIQEAGEGVMFAFKDTLKDIFDLKMKASDLQKLLSDSSEWLLNLLGLGPKEDEVEVISSEDLPAPVEEPVVAVDELEVKPVGVPEIDPELLKMNGFDDPEPIEYDEDDLN